MIRARLFWFARPQGAVLPAGCESTGVQTGPNLCNGCNCSKAGTPESSPLTAVRCSKPRAAEQKLAQNRLRVSGFSEFLHSPPEALRLVAWSPNTLGGSSHALLVQVPLDTLRESLFVSARASAWERAQRVPTHAVKDAQDCHGPRSLVRSSPAPRSTPGVYPGAPRAASQAASEQAASHTTTV